ncbi:hypothetical protein AVEN_60525-1 [Araneus ventricosus]|uniref:Uncharacterized protein n=1 Tax=Araneus ventricosus TaxID=182803 RepID=A0A4Y2FR78_ARAVE|nr:hypothetical protein AVEN_60525-1 [Araneus ventricosus]
MLFYPARARFSLISPIIGSFALEKPLSRQVRKEHPRKDWLHKTERKINLLTVKFFCKCLAPLPTGMGGKTFRKRCEDRSAFQNGAVEQNCSIDMKTSRPTRSIYIW